MVLYPSSVRGLDSLYRQRIWDYQWKETAPQGNVKTPYLTFKKAIGLWLDDSRERDKTLPPEPTEMQVERFVAVHKGTAYTIYFWSDNAQFSVSKDYQALIDNILKGIKPL